MKYINVIARKYKGDSIYVDVSNPGYEYVVVIPCHLRFELAEEFTKELYAHRPVGETYFVFECGNGDVPMVADSFVVARHYPKGGWYRGYLQLDEHSNLSLYFTWNA